MEMKWRFFDHNNKIYRIRREISSSRFKGDGEKSEVEMEWVKEYRDYLNADHVLMVGGVFLFCNEVVEVECEEYIEEEIISENEE